jgi:hypothetical protein
MGLEPRRARAIIAGMEIGAPEPEREIEIRPLEEPVPTEAPVDPAKTPEPIPA